MARGEEERIVSIRSRGRTRAHARRDDDKRKRASERGNARGLRSLLSCAEDGGKVLARPKRSSRAVLEASVSLLQRSRASRFASFSFTHGNNTADWGSHTRASSFERPREKGTGVRSRSRAPDEVPIPRSLAPPLSISLSLDVPSLLLLPRAVMSNFLFPQPFLLPGRAAASGTLTKIPAVHYK